MFECRQIYWVVFVVVVAFPGLATAGKCDPIAADGSHFLPTSRRDIDTLYVRAGHKPIGCILSAGPKGPHMRCEDGTDSPHVYTFNRPPKGIDISFDGKMFISHCQVGPMSQEDIDAQEAARSRKR